MNRESPLTYDEAKEEANLFQLLLWEKAEAGEMTQEVFLGFIRQIRAFEEYAGREKERCYTNKEDEIESILSEQEKILKGDR